MSKRILLFLATNIAIVFTLSVVMAILSVVLGRSMSPSSMAGLMIFCLVWGMGGAFISLAISRWIAKKFNGVRLIDGRSGNAELDGLYRTVERLARQANLPNTPEVGVYDSEEVNAFATGPTASRSLVAVSTGLLRRMTPEETEGVLAHELSHVANGDMVTMTLIQGVVNAFVMFFARIVARLVALRVDERMAGIVHFVVVIVCQIVFGFVGMMIVAKFSRWREFRADAGSASLAGREKMIAALRRLQAMKNLVAPADDPLATMKIAGSPRGVMALLMTHPPLEDRIAALQAQRA